MASSPKRPGANLHGDGDRRFRALRPSDPDDLALLQAISRGQFATAGLRNRDLRRLLYTSARPSSPQEVRRLCARISRKLRLLRAHGVIKRIPKTAWIKLARFRVGAETSLGPAGLGQERGSTTAPASER